MGNVKVVTDSTADLPQGLIEALNISVVPLKVHFGSDTYEDGVDLSPDEFYEKLGNSELMPSTSQPTPFQFEEQYRSFAEDGYSSIISIHLSSRLSGTYQSAVIASQELEGEVDVTVVDSKKASYAIGIIVTEIARMAKDGAGKDECLARLDELLSNTAVYFMVDTLEYLEKNGRIGKASAVLGSLLKIKPILSLNGEGEVYPADKARGSKKAVSKIIAELEKAAGGSPVHIGLSHARAEQAAEDLASRAKEHLDVRSTVITTIGPVIGAHVGPGTVSISVMKAD
ncbi:DegV family protein [Alteribacter natronophilus]|uniref:DegV family protein n=1 Tax=Alteribacter natronophilus TaxID=2583810 RepID=UPI00110DD8CF|nr:DegV family protein [Alteribacter natronophilus]TMW73176.1 DegV family protein [Alteribacter natronophilus]